VLLYVFNGDELETMAVNMAHVSPRYTCDPVPQSLLEVSHLYHSTVRRVSLVSDYDELEMMRKWFCLIVWNGNEAEFIA
jgi:hypothetical protein